MNQFMHELMLCSLEDVDCTLSCSSLASATACALMDSPSNLRCSLHDRCDMS